MKSPCLVRGQKPRCCTDHLSSLNTCARPYMQRRYWSVTDCTLSYSLNSTVVRNPPRPPSPRNCAPAPMTAAESLPPQMSAPLSPLRVKKKNRGFMIGRDRYAEPCSAADKCTTQALNEWRAARQRCHQANGCTQTSVRRVLAADSTESSPLTHDVTAWL